MDYLTKISEALHSLGLLHSDIKKISGQIETATSEYKTKNDKEQPAPVVNAVLHRPQAEIDNEEARATRHEGRDTNRLLLETIGVGMAAIVAVATLVQLILTKRAVQIAAISAVAAQKSASASEENVKLTQKSIERSIAQFEQDQRAWIGMEGIVGIPEVGKPFDVSVAFRNSGKTPAINATILGGIRPEQALPHVGDMCKNIWHVPISTTVFAPNGTFILPLHPSRGTPMLEGWSDRLKAAGGSLYSSGCVKYDDIFRGHHWLTFCAVYKDSYKQWATCENGNATGDGAPPN